MKRFLMVSGLTLALLLAPLAAVSQPIPPEVKSFTLRFLKDMGEANTDLVSALDRAERPEQMTRAIDAFTTRIEPLVDGMIAMEEKHREFFAAMSKKGDDESSGDAEIDRAMEEFEVTGGRIEASMSKLIPHLEDPGLQAALQRLQQLMERLTVEYEDEEDHDDDEEW